MVQESPVVLGVAGGIAAYKAVELLRILRESGIDVVVVPTANALRFVGAPTWEALSGRPVATDVWANTHRVPHVRLGQQARAVVVAPATADLLARAVSGIADDLLTNTLLTASCPVIMAPAMHTEMWQHPATQRNVHILRARGVIVLEPAVGRLTGTDSGPGRLADPSAIAHTVRDVLRRRPQPDLLGVRVLISAGGTRESWDPVRFIGNRSSGRQGIELARTAISRGAEVTLVAAAIEVEPPAGALVVRVESAEDLRAAMHAHAQDADVVIMAAAVADFRPADIANGKIKKSDFGSVPELALERTTDVLAELVVKRGESRAPLIVGFAAETARDSEDLLALGQEKLARKGCDLLVVNDVAAHDVFGSTHNSVLILSKADEPVVLVRQPKVDIADALWDTVRDRIPTR
jgi:phosphopantothenoylcysteine decarboxylase/phosphopantothenate--cysteine ligase